MRRRTEMKNTRPHRKGRRGYTLIEALLMIVILSIIAAGVGTSLTASAHSTESNENTLQIDNALASQMETYRATWKTCPLGAQNTSIMIGSVSYPMAVDIEDADPGSG